MLEDLAASGITVGSLLRRHVCGDWAHMDAEDRAANIQAVADGSRILTSFVFQSGRLWIITEAMSDITEDGQAKRQPSGAVRIFVFEALRLIHSGGRRLR